MTNMMGNTVSVIDTATNTVTKSVNVGRKPSGIAVTLDGTRIYVANEESYNVSVIDTATNNVIATVDVDAPPLGIAVASLPKPVTNNYLVQAEGSSDVYLIENGMKRHFTSPEALLWNGYSFDDVKTVTSETLQKYPDGDDISITQAIIDKYHELGGEPIFGASLGEGEKDGDKDSDGVYCSYVNFENGSIECFKNGEREGQTYAVFNPLYAKWASMGYAKSVLGYPIDNMSNEETSKFGTKFRCQNFANGTENGSLEYNISSGNVFVVHGPIFKKWGALGYAQSDLGLPIKDQENRSGHWYCEFEGGNISWDDSTGDYKVKLDGAGSVITVGQGAPNSEIKQSFMDAYDRNGGVNVLGNSTKEVHRAWGYLVQDFPGASGYAGGIIMYNSYNMRAYYIHGEIWDKYYELGGPNAKTDIEFVLGPPKSDIEPYIHSQPPATSHNAEFRYQNFEGGALEYNITSGNVVEIHGEIFTKWKRLGYASSELGLVTSNEKEADQSPIGTEGRVSDFEDGHIYWHRNGANANKAFETHGVIDDYYISQGGSNGSLGFPVSDQYTDSDGHQRSNFERGYIVTTDGVNCLAYSTKDSVPPTLTIVHPIYLHDNMIDLSGTAYDANGILNNKVGIMVVSDGLDYCPITYAPIISSYWSASDIPLGYGNNEIKVSVRDSNYNLMEVTTSVYCPYPDFSFAHITDVHVGDKDKDILLEQTNLHNIIFELNNDHFNSKFVLVTGDLVFFNLFNVQFNKFFGQCA